MRDLRAMCITCISLWHKSRTNLTTQVWTRFPSLCNRAQQWPPTLWSSGSGSSFSHSFIPQQLVLTPNTSNTAARSVTCCCYISWEWTLSLQSSCPVCDKLGFVSPCSRFFFVSLGFVLVSLNWTSRKITLRRSVTSSFNISDITVGRNLLCQHFFWWLGWRGHKFFVSLSWMVSGYGMRFSLLEPRRWALYDPLIQVQSFTMEY